MASLKKVQYLDDMKSLSADDLAQSALKDARRSGKNRKGDFDEDEVDFSNAPDRELTAAEIERRTKEIEAAKIEKKRRREHRRRLRQVRSQAEKRSRFIAPLILIISVIITFLILLIFSPQSPLTQ